MTDKVMPQATDAAPATAKAVRALIDEISVIKNTIASNYSGLTATNKGLSASIQLLTEKLGSLEDILATLNDFIEIDATQVVSGVLDDNRVPTLSASKISGGSTTIGSITTTGAASIGTTLSTGSSATIGGPLYDPDAATFNITGPRLTVWVETATGRLGNTASSRRYKMNERAVEIDAQAVLALEPRMFNYIDEIRKRDDPTYENYVGPEYVVAEEVGLMAEDLHDAGLTHLVYYEEVNGEMVPASVDYVMWGVTLHVAMRHVAAENAQLRADVNTIAEHLNLEL
jgi:hypothetical protein